MRVQRSSNYTATVDSRDRVISTLSYITMGMVGFIWMIFCYFTKKDMSNFLKFNCYQSIILALIIYILGMIASIFINVIAIVPVIGNLIMSLIYFLFQYPAIGSYSIYQVVFFIFIIYLSGFSLLGKYPIIPGLSNQIKQIKKN